MSKLIKILFPGLCTIYYTFIHNLFHKHNWEYWDVKLKCNDKKTLDGTILYNNIRRCNTCQKQMQLKMTPGNFRWKETFYKLPTNTNVIEAQVNLIGSINKQQIRDNKIDDILS